MRHTFFVSAALCALVACESESSNVGANPSAGSAGASQAGAAGQAQGGAGQAGASQAGAGGAAAGQAGSGGQAEAGAGGQPAAGQAGASGKKFDTVASNLPRDDGSAVSEADRQAIVADNNSFAYDLYGQLRNDPANDKKNIFFSPLSMTMALGMTSAGAQGETQAQIAKALHFSLSQQALHPALNWLSLELGKRPQQALDFAKNNGASVPPDVSLNLANALWGSKELTWKTPFLDTMARSYGTGINLADFFGNPDGERLIINDWVAEQTENRILDLLPPNSIVPNTRIVLVNAINFTFPWGVPFDKGATAAAPFQIEGGAKVDVETMRNEIHGSYAEDDLAQSLAIPLYQESFSLVVYAPKEGKFAGFEASLAAEVASLKGLETPGQVDLTLPRFKFVSSTLSMRDPLKQMGMVLPFSAGADFHGLTDDTDIALSNVYHKAMIGLDESGVEAAAATAVVGNDGGIPGDPKVLHVDRSFLLGIRDNATGALLFFGRIIDPTQK